MSRLNLEKTVDKARVGLKKIQRSGDGTKRFYLVLLSSLAMTVVIGLWFFYLNVTLPAPSGNEVEAVKPGTAVVEKPAEDSFFKIIARGAGKIFGDLRGQFVKIGESLNQVKEFSLEGKELQFTPEEPLNPTPLP